MRVSTYLCLGLVFPLNPPSIVHVGFWLNAKIAIEFFKGIETCKCYKISMTNTASHII